MGLPNFHLGIRLDKIYLLRRMLLNRAAKEHGLYLGQVPVLEYIMDHPGCTQQELAHWARVTPASVALTTRRLVSRGLIEKETDPRDTRCKHLTATALAFQNREQGRRLMDRCDEALFAGFSEEEKQQLLSFLDRMLSNAAPGPYRELSPKTMLQIRRELKELTGEDENLC